MGSKKEPKNVFNARVIIFQLVSYHLSHFSLVWFVLYIMSCVSSIAQGIQGVGPRISRNIKNNYYTRNRHTGCHMFN